jgi:hypothetical protein
MIDDEILLDMVNKQFRMSIPLELYKMRNAFCPDDGKIRSGWTCPNECPIYRKYYHTGLSCNQSLDQHPDECVALMGK